jgi:hypothetical protein
MRDDADNTTPSLSDVMATLRWSTDTTHKYWAYYQVVTGAAVGLAWSAKALPVLLLASGYYLFAILNMRLIYVGQQQSSLLWTSIQRYAEKYPTRITHELEYALRAAKPDVPRDVSSVHAFATVLATLAILASWEPANWLFGSLTFRLDASHLSALVIAISIVVMTFGFHRMIVKNR